MKSIKLHSIFSITYAILLLSRIAVLTGNYIIPVDPRLIEIVYIIVIMVVVLYQSKGRLTTRQITPGVIIILMAIHCVLWSTFFCNPLYSKYIATQFSSQIVFVIVIFFTSFALKYFQNYYEFISVSLYAMGMALTVQLLRNLSELNLSNIMNVLNLSERSRANFGFGHYNTLGSACLCVIILETFLYEKNKKIKLIDVVLILEAVIMMLCSASRGALTGTVFFIMILVTQKIYDANFSKRTIAMIHLFEFIVVLFLVWFAMGLDMKNLLQQAQRLHLFEVAIPEYLNSGRVLIGVGYTSNVAYGNGTIFGRILWLDNAYVYYLVSSGILGVGIIGISLIIMGIPIFKHRHTEGKVVFSLFCTYLYRALFEVNIFESGYIMNYIYLPIFFAFIYVQNNKSRLKKQRSTSSIMSTSKV